MLSILRGYTCENNSTYMRIPRSLQQIGVAACITSCGVAHAGDLPTTADGWKIVGISPMAEAFWIKTGSISGSSVDRQVPLAIGTPSMGMELSMAHIDCSNLVFYRRLQDGRQTRPVRIANGSTWESIAEVLCKANAADSLPGRRDNTEKSIIETSALGMKRYNSVISINPWMNNAAEYVCKRLASGASLESAGGDTAVAYSEELLMLWRVRAGDSMRDIDMPKAKESIRPIVYIAMSKCPGLFSAAPLYDK